MALNKWTPESDPMVLRRVGNTGKECAELSKVCSRITIQGLHGIDPATNTSNRDALTKEIADVLAQCYVTMRALTLDHDAITRRVGNKEAQMYEWEAMFAPRDCSEPWEPRPGELVRYGDGSTALVLHGDPHAGGWHGTQCMGGSTFYSRTYEPTQQDRKTWAECAVKWRNVSLDQAMQEAGLPNTEVVRPEGCERTQS
jgi:hypothetical protein